MSVDALLRVRMSFCRSAAVVADRDAWWGVTFMCTYPTAFASFLMLVLASKN